MRKAFLLITLGLASFAPRSSAQILDPSFYPLFSEVGGIVYSAAIQPDQKVIVAGVFTEASGRLHTSITRVQANGAVDAAFANVSVTVGGTVPGTVYDVKLQPDGKIVIVGDFRTVSGQQRFGLARLNADGTLDTGFQNGMAGIGASRAYAAAIQPDGKIIVVGNFFSVNGVARSHMVRLNTDGSVDNSFANTTSSGQINSVALQPDGKIVIGGRFQAIQLIDRRRIARLNSDGTLDTTFLQTQFGANNDVAAVSVQSDGKILVAGDFTAMNGVNRSRLARLDTNGDLDTTFQNGLSGANNLVNSISQLPNGQIMIGGFFTSVNATSQNKFARLSSDGAVDPGFTSPIGSNSEYIYPVVMTADGKFIAGGSFQNVGGVLRQHIARFNADGSLDTSFGLVYLDQQGGVKEIARQPDGKLIVAGFFRFANGIERNKIVRLNADGTYDSTFNPPPLTTPNYYLQKILVLPDGKILVAGNFDTFLPYDRKHLMRLNADGSVDSTFQHEISSSSVDSLDVQADGKIIIGGNFNFIGAQPRGNIARLNIDGSLDTTFMQGLAGTSGHVLSIVAQPDGKIVIGGSFQTVNGVSMKNVARLNSDGTLDSSFTANTLGMVEDIKRQPDGKYLIGGYFSEVNGTPRGHVARLNADGSLDTTFMNGLAGTDGEVFELLLQNDGRIYVAGMFNQVNGVTRRLARLHPDGTLDTSFRDIGIREQLNPHTLSLCLEPDGDLLVGGLFSTIGGVPRSGLIRLGLPETPFDFDGDGKTDLSIFRPNGAEWWINRSSNGSTFAAQFGATTDRITPADFTGDGKADIAFFRPSSGEWYILRSEDFSFFAFPFGTNGDVPAPADYDGDGIADAAVFRPSINAWFVRQSGGGTMIETFGSAGDVPVVSDYDGDGKADIAIYRPSLGQWWVKRSGSSVIAFTFGESTDKPVQGDYTGDGKSDVAFWRPSTGQWFILRSEDFSFYAVPFGTNGDIPSPGDYDGDGKFDTAVFRPSNVNWYVDRSTAGVLIQQFGSTGDVPVPNAFVP